MVDTTIANWQYAVGAEDKSVTFGTDPLSGMELDLLVRSSLNAFPSVEQTSSDGRDVTGAGEEGGPPKILATRGQWNYDVPRARTEEIAWLLGYSLGDVSKVTGTLTAPVRQLFTVIPATDPGVIERFTLETVQHTDVNKRFLDCFLNSITLRMETGASNRTVNASAELVMPSCFHFNPHFTTR